MADLRANPSRCSLAYWHHPLFSSGFHGSTPEVRRLWRPLYRAGVEMIVNGHDHDYERFAPQRADGRRDDAGGIREFEVGTGGGGLRSFRATEANSEVRNANTHGVLRLALTDGAYRWDFVPVAGQTFTDGGAGTCH